MNESKLAAITFADQTATWSGLEVCVRKGAAWAGSDELSAASPRLFAMLDEVGGHLEARPRRGRRSVDGFRGARHLSFVPAGTEVWGHCDQPASFTAIFIQLEEWLIDEVREDARSVGLEPRFMFNDPLLWGLASNLAAEVIQPAQGSRLLGDSLAQAIAVKVLNLQESSSSSTGGLASWQVRRVVEYLSQNFSQEITTEELAALVGLSTFHFARSFKRSTGLSPGRYQSQLRLERAKHLLCNTRMKLIDIALEIGFDAPHSLTRLFQREEGLSPLRYRQSHGG